MNAFLRYESDGIWFDLNEKQSLRVHPAAALFGALPDVELNDLADDIRAHGLHKSVELWVTSGEVLDGVNRLIACRIAGIPPTFIHVKTDDPIAYVISVNERRRHMTASARAVIADQLAQLSRGRTPNAQNCAFGLPVSQKQAAEMMNVSRRSVQDARVVRTHAEPEVKAAVTSGLIPVDVGAALAKLPAAEQRKAAKGGKGALAKAAKGVRKSRKLEAAPARLTLPKATTPDITKDTVLAHLLEVAARSYIGEASSKKKRDALEQLADDLFEKLVDRYKAWGIPPDMMRRMLIRTRSKRK